MVAAYRSSGRTNKTEMETAEKITVENIFELFDKLIKEVVKTRPALIARADTFKQLHFLVSDRTANIFIEVCQSCSWQRLKVNKNTIKYMGWAVEIIDMPDDTIQFTNITNRTYKELV